MTDSTVCWTPPTDLVNTCKLTAFTRFAETKTKTPFSNYTDLHQWSVSDPKTFWKLFWEFAPIQASTEPEDIVDSLKVGPNRTWFSGATLNFTENLLQHPNPQRIAIIERVEDQDPVEITFEELRAKVAQVAVFFRKQGLNPGDRVCAIMPNIADTIVGMLASASIGAIWSSCSPDFGTSAIIDRFSQIAPKLLLTTHTYSYNGKTHSISEKIQEVVTAIPSIQHTLISGSPLTSIKNATLLSELPHANATELTFEQLPFDHPLYIMYSSGTTGLPKSIVHGQGGTLIQHLKELSLHTNLGDSDVLMYYTTCGWMMWNWMVSSLALGTTLVLYDGSPFYPSKTCMWDFIDAHKVTVFGTSAKFLAASEKHKVFPINTHSLSSLKCILSTGSPLLETQYDYVYSQIKSNLQLSSISGGTDIISCFALGNPTLPVNRGQLQCLGLGMDVVALGSDGHPIKHATGELVCRSPFPSRPLYFWNDSDTTKYSAAYFTQNPGMWTHGDFIEIHKNGAVSIHGRSDATLNPGGVRIGTAEIYRQIESLPDIVDSLVTAQKWKNDERIVLFITLHNDHILDQNLKDTISTLLKTNCSPRHVPGKIVQLSEIPTTLNGKKVEVTVRNILNNRPVTNLDAIKNPHVLDEIRQVMSSS